MKYFKKIEGERLYLSPINPDDFELFTEWVNDPDVAKYVSQHRKVLSLNAEKDFLEVLSKDGYNFSIVLKENNQLIGSIGFPKFNLIDGTAEIGLLIGPKDQKGKGYGPEAMELLINYGFNTLNLMNIELGVYAFNDRGIKAYKKIGFKEYGRRTKAKFSDGQYHDLIMMEILNDKLK